MPTVPFQDRLLRDVPLFPLPNVVLLPRAVLPLHIFEPRYRRMVADALAGERRIAMALSREELSGEAGVPAIHGVVCVGRIAAHERLDDGRYNVLLEGELRAEVVEENRALSYRRADLRPLARRPVFDSDLAGERRELTDVLRASELAGTQLGSELAKLFDGPIATADVADICAFHLLDDVPLKQRLLEERDVAARVRDVVRAVSEALPRASPGDAWPRPVDLN